MSDNEKLPQILAVNELANTRLFKVQSVDLEFSNGEHRTFERLQPGSRQAVVIAAMKDSKTILLVKEYAVGLERYDVGLPKGLVDQGESILDAANRELQEEVGMKAKKLIPINSIALAPNYMSHKSELILAYELSLSKLQGDEPEPLEVIPFDLTTLDQAVLTGKICEARSIASLYIIKNYLSQNTLL